MSDYAAWTLTDSGAAISIPGDDPIVLKRLYAIAQPTGMGPRTGWVSVAEAWAVAKYYEHLRAYASREVPGYFCVHQLGAGARQAGSLFWLATFPAASFCESCGERLITFRRWTDRCDGCGDTSWEFGVYVQPPRTDGYGRVRFAVVLCPVCGGANDVEAV
jgi:hypothetical protein